MYLIIHDNDYLKIDCELKVYLYNEFKTKGYFINENLSLIELAKFCIENTKDYKKYINKEILNLEINSSECDYCLIGDIIIENLVNNDDFIKEYCCNIYNLITYYAYDNIIVFDEDLNLVGRNIKCGDTNVSNNS